MDAQIHENLDVDVIKLHPFHPDELSCSDPGPPAEDRAPRERAGPGECESSGATGGNGDAPGLTALLKAYLDWPSQDEGKTWRQRLVEALLDQAVEGNLRALQEVWIRLEGKPGATEPASTAPLAIDDALARKILQAGREDDEDPPDD